MEMVAEGVLQTSTHLGMCKINPTFTAIVEGKEASEVLSIVISLFPLFLVYPFK